MLRFSIFGCQSLRNTYTHTFLHFGFNNAFKISWFYFSKFNSQVRESCSFLQLLIHLYNYDSEAYSESVAVTCCDSPPGSLA